MKLKDRTIDDLKKLVSQAQFLIAEKTEVIERAEAAKAEKSNPNYAKALKEAKTLQKEMAELKFVATGTINVPINYAITVTPQDDRRLFDIYCDGYIQHADVELSYEVGKTPKMDRLSFLRDVIHIDEEFYDRSLINILSKEDRDKILAFQKKVKEFRESNTEFLL